MSNKLNRSPRSRPGLGGFAAIAIGWFIPATCAVASTVELWFNAFIPSIAVPQGTAFINKDGRTFIADPLHSGICYSTDDRSFSEQKNASSRVSVRLTLDIDKRRMTVRQQSVLIGPSHKYHCNDLAETTDSPRSSSTECVSISSVKVSARFIRTVGVTVSAANPFFQFVGEPCSLVNVNLAGRIDFAILIAYDILRGEVEVKGNTGTFPAFEGYYQLDGGTVRQVFRKAPLAKTSPMELFDLGLGLNTENFEAIVLNPMGGT